MKEIKLILLLVVLLLVIIVILAAALFLCQLEVNKCSVMYLQLWA